MQTFNAAMRHEHTDWKRDAPAVVEGSGCDGVLIHPRSGKSSWISSGAGSTEQSRLVANRQVLLNRIRLPAPLKPVPREGRRHGPPTAPAATSSVPASTFAVVPCSGF